MNGNSELKAKAFNAAIDSIDPNSRMPLNVFRPPFHSYYFFDPDVLFSQEFFDIKNFLLDGEDAQVLCLINLGVSVQVDADKLVALYLDRKTTSSEYMSSLETLTSAMSTDGHPGSWMILLDRYVFSSENNQWVVYCEKAEEIAIIAFRSKESTKKFSKVLEPLQAVSLGLGVQRPPQCGFKFERLLPSFQKALLENYAPSKHSDEWQ